MNEDEGPRREVDDPEPTTDAQHDAAERDALAATDARGGTTSEAADPSEDADERAGVGPDATTAESASADDANADGANADDASVADTSTADSAATLEAEAVAARDAVEEASKPESPRYPPPDARTQKVAGWGCILLMIGLTVGFVVVFRVAFLRLTSLDTNMNGYEVTTAPGSETRRADREPSRAPHTTAPEGGGVPWRTELDPAFREAGLTNRPLLLHFEARWAMASRDMLTGTYANVTVREALDSFVPVRIDLTERDANEEELVRRYGVEGLPHVVYIAPDGHRLRPDSKTLVDASDMEVFLQEALGAWQDGRRYEEPIALPDDTAGAGDSPDETPDEGTGDPPAVGEADDEP